MDHRFSGKITIEINLNVPGLEQSFRETISLLKHVLRKEDSMALSLDDLKSKVESQRTVENSMVTLMQGLSQQLNDALANNDTTKIQAIADELDANTKIMSDAVVANTPAAAGAGSSVGGAGSVGGSTTGGAASTGGAADTTGGATDTTGGATSTVSGATSADTTGGAGSSVGGAASTTPADSGQVVDPATGQLVSAATGQASVPGGNQSGFDPVTGQPTPSGASSGAVLSNVPGAGPTNV